MENNELLRMLELFWKEKPSDTESVNKQKLINELIYEAKCISPFYEEFFSFEQVQNLIALCHYAARLPKTKDKILIDFISGLCQIYFIKDELKREEISRLMNPLMDIVVDFFSSKEYRDHIISMEISGHVFTHINNTSIRHSKKAIRQHIERIKAFPIVSQDISIIDRDFRNYMEEHYSKDLVDHPEEKTDEDKIEQKPTFKPEIIDLLFHEIKDFFDRSQQPELLKILTNGTDAKEKLTFRDNGIRLADSFKQLYSSDLITGCTKRTLEDWVLKNFNYMFRNSIKSFKPKYLNDIISSNKLEVKRPIFDVIRGEIKKL